MTLPQGASSTTRAKPPTRTWWDAVRAAVGAALGVAPHVLHHVGFLAGAAFLTGAGGNALFFLVGLGFSAPLLRRLHRRFGTWVAPAIAVVGFAAMFSLSALVIGPAIGSGPDAPVAPDGPPHPVLPDGHSTHHG